MATGLPHGLVNHIFNLTSNRVVQIWEKAVTSNSFHLREGIDVTILLSTSTISHHIAYTCRFITQPKNNFEEGLRNHNIMVTNLKVFLAKKQRTTN